MAKRDLKKDMQALYDLQGHLLHPASPLNKQIMLMEKALKEGGATPAEIDAAKMQAVHQYAKNELFGGEFPDDASVAALKQQELAQRAEALGQSKEGSAMTPEARLQAAQQNNPEPLAQQLSTLQLVRNLVPEQQPQQTMAMPAEQITASPGKPANVRAPAPRPAAPKLAGGAVTDDDKLSEAQLTMLYNLALGNKGIEPSFYEKE